MANDEWSTTVIEVDRPDEQTEPPSESKPVAVASPKEIKGETSENEAEDSSSESSESGSSSSPTSSCGPAVLGNKLSLLLTDESGKYLCVSCAENEAKFYLNRFARGSIGKCILFKEKWLTPNEFQAVSGRQSSKDWKRSIRLRGRCLKEYINQGLFQEHVKACNCRVCSGKGIEHADGEVTLAPKRRRLNPEESSPIRSEVTPRKLATSEKKKGRPPKTQKVWSPSGEVAPEASSNDEMNVTMEDEEEAEPAAQQEEDCPQTSRKSALYRTELGSFARKPSTWDADEVADFLRLHSFGDYAAAFRDADIDGTSLFLLKERHLVEQFSMKLGPALRLLDTIDRLKHPPIS